MTDEDLGQEIIRGTGCLPSIGDIRHIGATGRRLVTAELAAKALPDEDALRSDILNAMHEPCENCATDIIDAMRPTLSACVARAEAAEAENARLREALEKLARLGNGDHYGNSIGNEIARAALGDKS